MKRVKKLLALMVALVMMSAVSITALAANITVSNAVEGEKYTAYKIFDVTTSGSGNSKTYAYTMKTTSPWVSVVQNYRVKEPDVIGQTSEKERAVFILNASTSDPNKYVVTINTYTDSDGNTVSLFGTGADAAAFAQYLAANIPESGLAKNTDYFEETAVKSSDADGNAATASFQDLTSGYYFVTTSLGTLCALNTNADDVNIEEKNSVPALEKKILVSQTENGSTTERQVDSTTASIGDTIKYQITVTDGKGTDKQLVVHDVMDPGLSLVLKNDNALAKDDFTVVALDKDNKEITMGTDCTWSAAVGSESGDGVTVCTFEITFSNQYISKLSETDKVVITYCAKLNENAEIATATNDNTAWLTYSQQSSKKDTVTVKTYQVDLVKTGVENESGSYPVLNGAKFKLYDAKTGGNEIGLMKVEDEDGKVLYYRPVLDDETAAEIELGEATIKGLGNGTYYLEETKAPTGYNGLTEREEFTIKDANLVNEKAENNVYTRVHNGDKDTGVQIINKAGSLLPSTGGMGTTIFYVIGGILVVGAGVLLITKRRMDDNK